MFNSLLFVHLVIAITLIIVILLQKTSSDGLSGIGGGNNMGIMSGRAAANFLTRTTIILAVIFFINALILANLSTNNFGSIGSKLRSPAAETVENQEKDEDNTSIPMAK